jgi:L-alanine-DL-glutamate epimerase-like enolase superfamily enzyme
MDRRSFLTTAGGATLAVGCFGAKARGEPQGPAPSLAELDLAAAAPVLKRDLFPEPVIVDSVRLLKRDKDYLVHVRSQAGAEGVSLVNPPRGPGLAFLFKQSVAPFFLGKDARSLEDTLWKLYRNEYKLYGLLFWSMQAWMEFAILDMLGRIARKPLGALVGNVVRTEIPFYIASGRRDTTPEQEIDHLKKLVQQSGAKALKFRVGGRMSRNADAMPGRTEKLIPLVRKSFGDDMVIHADSNSSYDPPKAIEVGRMLEEIKCIHYEEPCPFDHLEDTRKVADALEVPVALGEQEFSDWRFRWLIANHAVDIVQPDLYYYGGFVRSMRVARMAAVAKMPTKLHLSDGFGFVYTLHFDSCIPDMGAFQEYKLGLEKYANWFEPAIAIKDGKMSVPQAPGVGIRDIKGLVRDAVEV